MQYTAADIQKLLDADAQMQRPGVLLTTVAYDTRRISRPHESLFFAIDGKTRSGSDFVVDAYKKGVRTFVVKPGFDTRIFEDSNFIYAENPLKALCKLAAKHRKNFKGLVIGITGSNGKTIVKEWLNHLLHSDFHIHRSPRSYNSTLGVAVSLLGVESWHDMAIIEAGISHPGDMAALEAMIKPNMGIFTHLGSAHNENFQSLAEKAAEKMKLFRDSDVLVYPADAAELKPLVEDLKTENPLLKTMAWGRIESAGYRIVKVQPGTDKNLIHFVHRATEHELAIPFSDEASVENAMSCLCSCAALERWDPDHISKFKDLPALENRLAFTEGRNGNYLVNDSYSNDPDSLEVALDFLQRQQPGMPQVVVLSDMQQADADKNRLYTRVAALLREKGVKELIGVGNDIAAHQPLFSGFDSSFYTDTEDLMTSGRLNHITGSALLVKGARSFRLEKLMEQLQSRTHKTVLQINLNALRNNLNFFRHRLKPGVKVMAMVKAFGYGSGSFEAARTLQFAGADYLGVAYADEGVELRKAGISLPVMVMNSDISDLHSLLQYNLEPVVYNSTTLNDFAGQSQKLKIHVELDTGMHRLGFNPDEIKGIFNRVPAHISVASVFSHLAASEAEEHDNFTRKQIGRFSQACDAIETALGYTFLRHIANTGGILRFPESHFSMVRLGIGLYGVEPSGLPGDELEPVLTLKTTINQIKQIEPGDSVGYGRHGASDHLRRIAIIPVGYADGLWRQLGNGKGYALIQSKKARYTGNICMDMAMVDVTEIDCTEGDPVELFGAGLRVETLAEWCGTIPYEILTSVSERVRREYTGEN